MVGLLGLAPGAALAGPKAVLVEPIHLKVGEVEPDQVQHFNFTLKNDGDAPLAIQDLKPTCYCTTGTTDVWDVPAGGSTVIHMRVDPSDFVGDINKGIEITTNDPANVTLLVQADLKVRPAIAVVPPELDFGAVPATGSKPQSVDLKGPKERPFKVKSVTSDAKFLAFEQDPLDLDERAGVKISVKVLPGVPAGPFTAKVVVETDDAGKPHIEIPVRGMGPGGLQANPAKLVFESAAAGASVGSFEIAGGPNLKVTGVKTSSPQLEAKLEPAAGGRWRVQVKVASGAKPGRILGKVIVATSDAAQPELAVPVMGLVK
jgi:hypothetical protein